MELVPWLNVWRPGRETNSAPHRCCVGGTGYHARRLIVVVFLFRCCCLCPPSWLVLRGTGTGGGSAFFLPRQPSNQVPHRRCVGGTCCQPQVDCCFFSSLLAVVACAPLLGWSSKAPALARGWRCVGGTCCRPQVDCCFFAATMAPRMPTSNTATVVDAATASATRATTLVTVGNAFCQLGHHDQRHGHRDQHLGNRRQLLDLRDKCIDHSGSDIGCRGHWPAVDVVAVPAAAVWARACFAFA